MLDSVTAGTMAIPILLKAATLMKDKPDWNTGEHLPVHFFCLSLTISQKI
jgi:hypothetical protein